MRTLGVIAMAGVAIAAISPAYAEWKQYQDKSLGICDELTLMGALCGVEMTLTAANVPHRAGGVLEAMAVLGDSLPLRLIA